MRILCLIDNLGSGGAQRQMVNLSILWKQRGHEINFACYGQSDFFYRALNEHGIRVNWISNRNSVERIFKVRKYIRHAQAQVVVSFLETPNFIGCVAAIGRRKWKLITSERSANEASFHGLRARIFKFFERFSDWTVCNSYNAQKMWRAYCPQYGNRVSTIYNPVVMPPIKAIDVEHARRRIVVAASYQRLKNPINVIEAVHRMESALRNRLVIDWYGRKEGSADNKGVAEAAERLVKRYSLEDCFRLNGETTQIYDEMSRADAVGLFSKYEGLPNAICEGMTIGKPILMTRISDYEALVTQANGFLCDTDSVESIREAIEAFLRKTDNALREMGKASQKRAEALFNPAAIVGQWEALFLALTDIEKEKRAV